MAAALALALLPKPVEAADAWLKLRRQGVPALLRAARAASAPQPWRATWRLKTKNAGGLKGLRIGVWQRMVPASKDRPAVLATVTRLSGVKALQGVGVATIGDQIWSRQPGALRALAGKGELLFAPLPDLAVPLGLLAAAGLTARYEGRLVGEFDGIAIIVLAARYTDGSGWPRMKVGMSKRHHLLTMAEVSDKNGKALTRLLWLDSDVNAGVRIARRLRLRAMSLPRPFDLELVGVERGQNIAKLPVGAAALQ